MVERARIRVLDAEPRGRWERRKQPARDGAVDAARDELRFDASRPHLVELVEGHERGAVPPRLHASSVEEARQHLAMIETDEEVAEPEPREHVTHGGAQLHLDDRRRGTHHVDVALVELAEAALLRT